MRRISHTDFSKKPSKAITLNYKNILAGTLGALDGRFDSFSRDSKKSNFQ